METFQLHASQERLGRGTGLDYLDAETVPISQGHGIVAYGEGLKIRGQAKSFNLPELEEIFVQRSHVSNIALNALAGLLAAVAPQLETAHPRCDRSKLEWLQYMEGVVAAVGRYMANK